MNIGADSEARASPPVQELSEDQVRDKTEATLKEFLNIKDFKVTIVDCVLIPSAIMAILLLVHRPPVRIATSFIWNFSFAYFYSFLST